MLAMTSCGNEHFIFVTPTFGNTNDEKILVKPADNPGVHIVPIVVTDRLASDHEVALMWSGSTNQLDHWGHV